MTLHAQGSTSKTAEALEVLHKACEKDPKNPQVCPVLWRGVTTAIHNGVMLYCTASISTRSHPGVGGGSGRSTESATVGEGNRSQGAPGACSVGSGLPPPRTEVSDNNCFLNKPVKSFFVSKIHQPLLTTLEYCDGSGPERSFFSQGFVCSCEQYLVGLKNEIIFRQAILEHIDEPTQ